MKRTLASSSLLTTILFSLTVVALSLHGVRLIAAGTAVAASSSPSYGLEWSGDGSVRRSGALLVGVVTGLGLFQLA